MKPEELYRSNMKKYTEDTAFSSFTKIHHPSFKAILEMDLDAVPYLLKDIQMQHPDGEGEFNFCFWAAVSLLWQIAGDKAPTLPEEDHGRLAPIRKMWVDWGIQRGYLTPFQPTIPLNRENLHRFIPERFSALRTYVWRLITLPNRHRMKHNWDWWRAI